MKIYVRVNPKKGVESFCRCGMKFGKKWTLVEADDATFQRLNEEQMLEVSKTVPADYVDPDASAAPVAPTDAGERLAAIKDAIGKLDKADTALWTSTGMPKVPAIAAVTGWDITQQERDAAWAEIKGAQ